MARKRQMRTDALLDLAAEIVEEHGVSGLTMAALAEAADYAPASLYTYFPSRSALLAALQARALVTLGEVAGSAVERWDRALDGSDPRTAALARLWAFHRLFLAAPEDHAREFRLQQQLLASPSAESLEDAASVVPVAMSVLDVPRRLIDDAVTAGALAADTGYGGLTRTLAWVVALNGALLVDDLAIGVPVLGAELAGEVTRSLLVGWGASPDEVEPARTLAEEVCS